jgi:hypothetical protein
MGINFAAPDGIEMTLYSSNIHSFVRLYYVAIVLLPTITGYKQDQWMFHQKAQKVGDGQW